MPSVAVARPDPRAQVPPKIAASQVLECFATLQAIAVGVRWHTDTTVFESVQRWPDHR
jgi:hypothetical protein